MKENPELYQGEQLLTTISADCSNCGYGRLWLIEKVKYQEIGYSNLQHVIKRVDVHFVRCPNCLTDGSAIVV